MLSKVASSAIFWIFGMNRPVIEPRSIGPLVNTLTAMPIIEINLNPSITHLFGLFESCFFNVPWPYTWTCEMYMGRSLHIYIEHRNLETRKTLDDFFVQVRNFLLSLSLKVLRHKERETQSFYSGFFICPLTRVAPATRPRELAKANLLNSTHWLFQNLPDWLKDMIVFKFLQTVFLHTL